MIDIILGLITLGVPASMLINHAVKEQRDSIKCHQRFLADLAYTIKKEG